VSQRGITFRSRVLTTPRVPGTPTALEADTIRRRDGLDLEQAFRRVRQQIGSPPSSDLSVDQRLAQLEGAAARGGKLGSWYGTTVIGGAPSQSAADNLVVAAVSAAGVDYAFVEPADSTLYVVAYVPQTTSGTTGLSASIINVTRTSFRLVFFNGAGTVRDPTIAGTWPYRFWVFDEPA
jgi:hypothetical protein